MTIEPLLMPFPVCSPRFRWWLRACCFPVPGRARFPVAFHEGQNPFHRGLPREGELFRPEAVDMGMSMTLIGLTDRIHLPNSSC